MPAFIFMFLCICDDFGYESSSMKSVRANGRFVRSAPHNKTFVNVHSYYDSRCKFVV